MGQRSGLQVKAWLGLQRNLGKVPAPSLYLNIQCYLSCTAVRDSAERGGRVCVTLMVHLALQG